MIIKNDYGHGIGLLI